MDVVGANRFRLYLKSELQQFRLALALPVGQTENFIFILFFFKEINWVAPKIIEHSQHIPRRRPSQL